MSQEEARLVHAQIKIGHWPAAKPAVGSSQVTEDGGGMMMVNNNHPEKLNRALIRGY